MLLNRARAIGFVAAAGIVLGGCGVGATVGKTAAVARMTVVAAAHAATGTTPTLPTFPVPADPVNPRRRRRRHRSRRQPVPPGDGGEGARYRGERRGALVQRCGHYCGHDCGQRGPSRGGGRGRLRFELTPAGLAPRRQPSAAQVSQVIAAVHGLVPFFTPSAADVADAGNKVCTAFDQGKSFTSVSSTALDLVGAGSYSWLVPSSVAASAVRSLVNLYCPAYAARTI